MFGQSNTPFGSSNTGFGQPSNTAPAFGSPASAPVGGSLFGASPAPAFGASSTTGTFGSAFGAPAPSGGLFGSSSTGQPSAFGSTFGAPTTTFGAPTTTFGAPSTTFGAPSTTFGAPAPSGGLFGSTPAPTSTFGAPSGGLFGAPAPSSSTPFGSSASTGGFGVSTSSTFGGFGASSTTPSTGSTFGAFGSAPAPSGGLFGAPSPAPFGAPAPSAFAPSAPFGGTAAFGAPAPSTGGLFGSTSAPTAPLFGGSSSMTPMAGGSRAVPFQVTTRQDGTSTMNLESISAMPQYENKSPEEIRVEDYSQGNRGTPSSSAFGATTSGGLFGSPAPAATGAFGAPSTGLFGASAPSPFGAPAPSGFGTPSTGLFGSPSPAPAFGSSFGAPAPSTGLFGAPAPAPSFGSPAPAPFGGFGVSAAPSTFGAPAPSSGGLFGSSAPAPFGAPAPSGGLFGASTSSTFGAAPSGGLFGVPAPAPFGTPAPAPFGAAPSTGLFGSTAPAPSLFGGFGARPPGSSLFGSPPPAPAPFGFGFGPAPAPFGAPAPAPFGFAPAPLAVPPPQSAAPLPSVIPPNGLIIPPVANEVLEQQIRAMENQRKEFEQMDVWRGTTPRAAATIPHSLSEAESMLHSDRSLFPSSFGLSTPLSLSGGKWIRPRGFSGSTAASKSPFISKSTTNGGGLQFAPMGGDNFGLETPEAFVRSSVTHLVIKPEAMNLKPKLKLKLESPPSSRKSALVPEAANTTAALPIETLTSPPPAEPEVERNAETTPTQVTTPVAAVPESPVDAEPSSTKTPRVGLAEKVTSPGFDYYQQVIGTSSDAIKTPHNLQGMALDQKKRSLVPKLTKKGYEVSPPLEELTEMSEGDLAAVPGFAVKRPGFGMVEWEGSVDVRGADLDRIVSIEHQDVSVYNLDEEEGTKPAEGTKLNRPAAITFYDVFSKNGGARASDEEKDSFARKVERSTKRLGAEFVSYDKHTGVWKIRVRHFSRYTILEYDTDEEDNRESLPQLSRPLTEARESDNIVPTHATPFKPKATPYKPSRVIFDEMELAEISDEAEPVLVGGLDLYTFEGHAMAVETHAEQAVREIESVLQTNFIASEKPEGMTHAIASFENEGDDMVDSDSAFLLSVLGEPSTKALESANKESICQRLTQKCRLGPSTIDFGGRMGRSFRAGWLPNGTCFKIESQGGNSSRLVSLRPILAEQDMQARIGLLIIQLDSSTNIDEEGDCPIFAVPKDLSSFEFLAKTAEEIRHSPGNNETMHLFSYIASLKDQIAGFPIPNAHLEERCITPYSTRMVSAALNLLTESCRDEVNAEIQECRRKGDFLSAVFAALSNGDSARACMLAAEGGDFQLSALLAADLGGRNDVRRQLVRLAESGFASKLPPTAIRVLAASGGKLKYEDNMHRKNDSFGQGLDWRRRIILLLMQEPEKSLNHIIQRYKLDMVSGEVPVPCQQFMDPKRRHSERSVLFQVLSMLAGDDVVNLAETVDPRGFTSMVHDVSLSFHLAFALSIVCSETQYMLSPIDEERILESYESLLVGQGYWYWAVFVSLCRLGDLSLHVKALKKRRAKDLVLRHFDSKSPFADSIRHFLEDRVGVPPEWFEEALAYRSACQAEVLKFIYHALEFDIESAFHAFEELYLPYLFYSEPEKIQMLEMVQMASVVPGSLAECFNRFFAFERSVTKLAQEEGDKDLSAQISDLLEACRVVSKALSEQRDATVRSRRQLLFPRSQSKVISVGALILEAQERLVFLKVQLEGIAMSRGVVTSYE